ncbi:putative glycine-rich signal peptide protein [Pseudonocardia sp. Ae406_Ps2]|nr:hypothetical protein Ae331Ps2_0866c [Pseudonocardia sp. Ae331_Ps2]OLM05091.1 putative glycine-rich signal peptide protein [Pseudonocardia sp. Ae406_Ps2]
MAGQGGSTELPDSLQKFFKVTLGMEWPEGNEGNLRELSAAWADLAAALERAALDARRSGDALDDVLRGDTGAANAKLIGEDYAASLTELANGADEFRKATKNAAADIQKGKIMLVVMAAMTLAAVIELLVSLFGAIFVPAVLAAARVTLWALLRQMVKQMIQAVARLGLNKASAQTLLRGISKALAEATKRAALYGAGGAGLMAGLDGLIQVGQNSAGGREGYDLDSIGHSAIGGAIGGAGAGLARAAAGGVRSWSNSAMRNLNRARRPETPPLQLARHVRAFGILGYAGAQIMTAPASGAVINAVFGEDSNPFFGAIGALGGMRSRPGGDFGIAASKFPALSPTSLLDHMKKEGLGPSATPPPWMASGGPGAGVTTPTTFDGGGPPTGPQLADDGTTTRGDDGDSSPSTRSPEQGVGDRPPLVIPSAPTVGTPLSAVPESSSPGAVTGSSAASSQPWSSAAGARPEPVFSSAPPSPAPSSASSVVDPDASSPAGSSAAGSSAAGSSAAGSTAAENSAAGNSAAGNSAAGNDAAGNATGSAAGGDPAGRGAAGIDSAGGTAAGSAAAGNPTGGDRTGGASTSGPDTGTDAAAGNGTRGSDTTGGAIPRADVTAGGTSGGDAAGGGVLGAEPGLGDTGLGGAHGSTTELGSTPGGNAEFGSTSGGDAASSATPGGSVAGSATPGGSVAGSATPGGSVAGSATPGGIVAGVATPGGTTASSAASGGSAAGSATPGGSAAGSATPGATTANGSSTGGGAAGNTPPGSSSNAHGTTPETAVGGSAETPTPASVSEGRGESTSPRDAVVEGEGSGRGAETPGAVGTVRPDGGATPGAVSTGDGPPTPGIARDVDTTRPTEPTPATRDTTTDSPGGVSREPVPGAQTTRGDSGGTAAPSGPEASPPRSADDSGGRAVDGSVLSAPTSVTAVTPQPTTSGGGRDAVAPSGGGRDATTSSGGGRDTASSSGGGRTDTTATGTGSGAGTSRSGRPGLSVETAAGDGRTVGGGSTAPTPTSGGRGGDPVTADGSRAGDGPRDEVSPVGPVDGDRATWETSGSPFATDDVSPLVERGESPVLPATVSHTPTSGTPPTTSTPAAAGSTPPATSSVPPTSSTPPRVPTPVPSGATPAPPAPVSAASSATPATTAGPATTSTATRTDGAPPAAVRTGTDTTARTGDPSSGEHRTTTSRTPDGESRGTESRPATSAGRTRTRDEEDSAVVLPVPAPHPADVGPPAPRSGDDGGRSASLRPEHGAPVTPVGFREFSSAVGEDARGPIRDATDAFVRDVLTTPPDRPARAMTITGHGNGSMRRMPWSVDGTSTGRARAEAVRAVVLERLDELAREGGLGGREPSEFRVLVRADATPLTSGALRDTNRVAIIDYTTDDVAGTRSESTVTFGSGQHRPDPGADADIVALAGQIRERLRGGGSVRAEIIGDGTGRPAQRLAHHGGALIESSGRVAKTRLGSAEKWARDLVSHPADDPRPPSRWVVRPPSPGPEALLEQRRVAGRERAGNVAERLRELLGPQADRVHIATRAAVDTPDGSVPEPSRTVRAVVEQDAARRPETLGRRDPGEDLAPPRDRDGLRDGLRDLERDSARDGDGSDSGRSDSGRSDSDLSDAALSDAALAAAPVHIPFAEGSHRIAHSHRAAVDRATDAWIADVVAARRAGGPTPALVVTGHGNGSREVVRPWADRTGAEVTGRDRARSVHDVVEQRLAERLRTDRPGGLTREDFRIVSAGSALPPTPDAPAEQRRVAVIEQRADDVTRTDSVHDVAFDSHVTRLGDDARRDLTTLAGEVRERARLAAEAGEPPPRVELVGDGMGHRADRLRGGAESLVGRADTDRAGRPRNDVAQRLATGRARALAAAVFLRGQLADVPGVRIVHRAAVDAPDGVVPRPSRGVQAHVDAPVPRTVMGDPQGRHLQDVPRRVHVPLLGGRFTADVRRALDLWIARTGDPSAVHVWADAPGRPGGLSDMARRRLTELGVTVRDISTDLPSGTRATDRILHHRVRTGSFTGVGTDVALSVIHSEGGIWADPAVRATGDGPPAPLPATMPRMPAGVTDGEPLFPLLTGHVDGLAGPGTGLFVAPPGSALLQTLLNSDRLGEDGFLTGRLQEHLDGRPVDLTARADRGTEADLRTDLGAGRFRVDDHVLSPWTGRDVPAPAAASRSMLRVQSVGPQQRQAVADLIASMVPGASARRSGTATSAQLDALLTHRPSALHQGLPFDVEIGGRRYEAVVAIDHVPGRRAEGPDPAAPKTDGTEQIRRGTDNLVEGRYDDSSRAVPIAGSGGSLAGYGGAAITASGGDTVGHRTRKTVNNDVGYDAKHTPAADVPVRFTVTVRDESGAVVGPGPRALDGTATGWFDEPKPNPGARPAVELGPAAGPALSNAAVLDVRGAGPDAVLAALADQLPPGLLRPDSPGRNRLVHFLSDNNLAHHYERFTTGWVRSDELRNPGGPPVYVESRLVPKKGSWLAELDGKTTKQQRIDWGVEGSSSSRLGVSGELRGGWRFIPKLAFLHLGPYLGVGWQRSRGWAATHIGASRRNVDQSSLGAYDVEFVRETRVRWGSTSAVAPPARTPVELVLADSPHNARDAGLPVTDAVRDARNTDRRTDTLPPYLAAGLGIGRAHVHSLGDAPTRLRERIDQIIASVGGPFADLADGDGSHRVSTSSSTVRDLGETWRMLDHNTTQTVLGSSADSLYDGGVDLVLARDRFRRTEYLHLRISAEMRDVGDEGPLSGISVKTSAGNRTESVSGAGTGIEGSLGLRAGLGFEAGVAYPGLGGRASAALGHSDSGAGGTITGRRAVAGPAGPSHRVTGQNVYTITAERFSETNALGRLTGIGAPGRHVSPRTPVALPDNAAPIREPFALDVPVDEMLTPGTPPEAQRIRSRPRITMDSPVGPRQRDFAQTLLADSTFTWIGGVKERRTAAEAALAAAAGGDAVLGRRGTEDGRALEAVLAPQRVSNDRGVTERGIATPEQVHKRRWRDRRGTVVSTLGLYDLRVVDVRHSPSTERARSEVVYGGYLASGSSSNARGAQARGGFEVNDSSLTAQELERSSRYPTGSGGIYGGYQVGARETEARATLGARETFNDGSGGRSFVVKARGVVTHRATSWESNQLLDTVHTPTRRTATRYVDLPDHVFLSVGEEQMRAWGLLPAEENRPHQAPVDLQVPPTLRGDDPVGGLGWPTDDGLRAPLGDIERQLRRHFAGRLDAEDVALIAERLTDPQRGVSAADLKGLHSSLGGDGVPLAASRRGFFVHHDLSAHLSFVPDTAPGATRVEQVVHDGHAPKVEQYLADQVSSTSAHTSGPVAQVGGALGGRGGSGGEDPYYGGGSGGLGASSSRTDTHTDTTADTVRGWRFLGYDGPTAIIGQTGRLALTVARDGETIPGPTSAPFTLRHRVPAAFLSSLPDLPQPPPDQTRPAAPGGDAPRIDPDTTMGTVRTDGVAISRAVQDHLATVDVPDAFRRPGEPGRHQLDVLFSPEHLDSWIPSMLKGPATFPPVVHPTQVGVTLTPRISVTPSSLHTDGVSAALTLGAESNLHIGNQTASSQSHSGDVVGSVIGEGRDVGSSRGDARAEGAAGAATSNRGGQAPLAAREHETKLGDPVRLLGGRFEYRVDLELNRPGRAPQTFTVPTVTGRGMQLFLAERHAADLLGPMPETVRTAMEQEKARAGEWRTADAALVELQRRNDQLWLDAGPRGRATLARDRATEIAAIDADRRAAATRFEEAARAWARAKTDLDRRVREWVSPGTGRDDAVPPPPVRPAPPPPPDRPAPPVPAPARDVPPPAPTRAAPPPPSDAPPPPAVPHPSVPEVPTDAQAAAIGRALQVYDRPSGPDEVREAYTQWRGRGEPMPRGGDWSLAAAVANPDRAGDGPGAHAIGVEAEFLRHRLVNLEEYVSSGDELAGSAALTAVAEIGPAGMTLELITEPARLLDGDVDRIPVEESTAALDGVLNRLAAMTGSTPLSTIFPSPEYRLSPDADGVRVEPTTGGRRRGGVAPLHRRDRRRGSRRPADVVVRSSGSGRRVPGPRGAPAPGGRVGPGTAAGRGDGDGPGVRRSGAAHLGRDPGGRARHRRRAVPAVRGHGTASARQCRGVADQELLRVQPAALPRPRRRGDRPGGRGLAAPPLGHGDGPVRLDVPCGGHGRGAR